MKAFSALKKIVLASLAILIIATAVLLLLIHTSFAKNRIARYAEQYLERNYGVKARIESLDYKLSPPLNLKIGGVKVFGGPSGTASFLNARSIDLVIPYSSLWGDDFIIEHLVLDSPDIEPENLPKFKSQPKKEDSGRFEIRKATIKGGGLRYAQFRIQDIQLEAVVEPDAVVLKNFVARMDELQLKGKGELRNFANPKYEIDYEVQGDAASVSRLFPQAPPLKGPINAKGDMTGGSGYYVVDGRLQSDSLSIQGQPPFVANGTYKIDSRDKAAPYRIHLNWGSLPFASLAKFAPQLPPIASTTSGELDYSGTTDFWNGTGSFQVQFDPSRAKGMPVAGQLKGDLSRGAFQIHESNLAWGSSHLRFSGAVGQDEINAKLYASVPDPSAFAMFAPDLRKVPGSYRIDSTIRGPYKNLNISWNLDGTGKDLNLKSSGSYLTGPRRIQADASGQVGANVINRLSKTDLAGTFTFSGTASGLVTRPALQAEIEGKSVWFKETEIGDTTIHLASEGQVLQATAQVPKFATTAEGTYHFASKNYRMQAQFSDLTVDQIRNFLPETAEGITGSASGRITAEGNVKRIKASTADVYFEEASFVRGPAQVTLEKGSVVSLKNQVASLGLHVTMNEGRLDITGTVPLSSRGVLNVRAVGETDLRTVSMFVKDVEASGRVGLDVSVGGTFASPQFAGKVSSEDFQVSLPSRNITITQGKLQAELIESRVQLGASLLLNNSPIQAQGSIPLVRSGLIALHVTGTSDLRTLSMFTTAVTAEGEVTMDINVSGTIATPNVTGRIASESFSVSKDQFALTQAAAQADLSGTELRVKANGLLNGSKLDLNGVLPLRETAGSVSLKLASFPIDSVKPGSEITGTVSFNVDAQGVGKKITGWSALVSILPENVVIQGTGVDAAQPVQIKLANGLVDVQQFHLKAGNILDVSGGGRVNLDSGQIEGNFRTQAEMSILRLVMDDIQTSGELSANLQISGKMNDPIFAGDVRIKDGIIRIPESPILLERIQLIAPVRPDKIEIQTLTARMGGGTIQGDGEIALRNWAPDQVNLQLKAERVGIRYPEDLRSQMSADLILTGQDLEYLLAGKIQIVRSNYKEDIDPRERLVNSLMSEKEALAPRLPSKRRLNFELEVQTLEDFQMRNSLGRLQAAANLRVTGSQIDPRISGRVQVREGSEIMFEGNLFEVRRGNIDFYGKRRIDPVFDLELFTIARDVDTNQEYDITLPLSGPLSDLDDRDPTSSPALSPFQIYFLLLTGRADAQLSQAGSRFFQQQLAMYLAGQVFSDVQKKVANAFGLNRVEIQPEVVSSETTPGAKMILGKDFSSALSLIYSVSLTESKEQTWLALYRAKRNLTFRFVDQDDGSYTASVRHLIRLGSGVTSKSLHRPHRPVKRRVGVMNISNDSVLTDAELREIIGLEKGDTYDFWDTLDRLDKVEQELQKRGYLFAQAELEEKATSKEIVQLDISIKGGARHEMVFHGAQVGKGQQEDYNSFWREGFSEFAVVELVREDLLRRLWEQGHHRAEVDTEEKDENGIRKHIFVAQPGPVFQTVDLQFEGTKHYPAKDLQKDLEELYGNRDEMYRDAIHDFDDFHRKISALHVNRGLLDAEVEPGSTLFTQGRVEQKILVTEGPVSKITEVLMVNGANFPQELQSKLALQVGDTYNPADLMADELTIDDYYERKGYRKMELETEVDRGSEPGTLMLKYKLHTGGIAKVNDIRITGNKRTNRKLIEKRMELKPGDVLTQEKVANAQKNLTDLRIFHQATVRVEETDVPDHYNVIADVLEMRHYELTYGLRFDTEKGIGGEVQIADLSLFGSAHGLSAFTRISKNNQLFRTVYHSPTLAGLNFSSLISASYETGELLLRETNQLGLAEGQRYDLSLQKQYEVWGPFLLIGSYEFEHLRIRPIAAPEIPFDSFKISRLGATVFEDTRDDPMNATRGSFTSFDIRVAPSFLPTDATYVKGYSQFYKFTPFGRMLWASAIRVGAASDLGRRLITERFLAGGSYTIRGFSKDQVGPKDVFGNPIGGEAVFIINQELRFPLWKWFGGAVFYDAGNVYGNIGDFNPLELRHSLGFGLRINSPFGIARLDLGINPRRRDDEPSTVFHFSLGQAF